MSSGRDRVWYSLSIGRHGGGWGNRAGQEAGVPDPSTSCTRLQSRIRVPPQSLAPVCAFESAA